MERKKNQERQLEKEGEWWGQRTWEMDHTKKLVSIMTMEGRESTLPFISSLHPSLTGRLSITLGPFSPVGKGIISQWRQGGELPLFQIRHWGTTLSIPRHSQGGQVEERRRAVKRRTEKDKRTGRMEIEPTMKWRLRNIEPRQQGGGGRKEWVYFWKQQRYTETNNIVTMKQTQKYTHNPLQQIILILNAK